MQLHVWRFSIGRQNRFCKIRVSETLNRKSIVMKHHDRLKQVTKPNVNDAIQLTAELDRLITSYTHRGFTQLDAALIAHNYLGMQLKMLNDPDGTVGKMKKLMGDMFDQVEAKQ